jgi:predicted nuclease of predicted toxin-antitoxin system
VRLLADLHISPSTVAYLRTLGHDVVRVDAILPNTAADEEIVAAARAADRSILTQDLDFSAIIALSGARSPSLVTLRLASSRVPYVNEVLARALPLIEEDLAQGCAVTVEDGAIRTRSLPID